MCEILAPAGDKNSAIAAINSGADAIYLGLKQFSARSSADNFDISALKEIINYAAVFDVKVHVAMNTLVKQDEVENFLSAVKEAWNCGADAIIMQDIFLGRAVHEAYPQITLHLSTQAGVCNEYGALLAKEFGFSRVILARETAFEDIERIAKIIETEVFVQGALCTCFSGQCYFSSFAGGNSGNRGRCKQPCRKLYSIDRKGFESPAYALSLSDLSVGPRVKELLEAGVTSLKIEGRMRREEYVSAAVHYYRAILGGLKGEIPVWKSALARTYGRGGYTEGLAFGQDNLLSRKVQGHIGERIGTLELKKGKYYCKGIARKGDGFKILRGGEEVGGATCTGEGEGGFYLSSEQKLRAGDEVRITTDTSLAERLLRQERRREVALSLRFVAGEKPQMHCEGYTLTGEEPLQTAERAPLTEEELIRCFQKTDDLPLAPIVEHVETENAFLPKSQLNALRRAFYEGLAAYLAPAREQLAPRTGTCTLEPVPSQRTAVIAEDFEGLKADVLILKPRDYARVTPEDVTKGEGEKFLYFPPLLTAADEKLIAPVLPLFDGIYAEGSYGVKLAEKYKKPLFAGAGFNLTNSFAVTELKAAGAKYFVLSKELSTAEQRRLAAEGAFVLTLGSVKLMDLAYCPFGRTCKSCDRRGEYRLTDEQGRAFPLRRYRLSGKFCRFEVYNCVPLAGYDAGTGALVDASCRSDGAYLLKRAHSPEGALAGATKGHAERSML